MDKIQELFQREKYDIIISSLSKLAPNVSLLEELSRQNSLIVCGYAKNNCLSPSRTTDYLRQLSELLLKCASLQSKSDILVLELTALWNFLYIYIKHRNEVDLTNQLSIYHMVNRTLYRVCSTLPGFDRHRSTLIDLNPESRSTTYTVIKICLQLLQFILKPIEIFEPFSDCCRLIFILAASDQDFSVASEYLEKLRELEERNLTSSEKKFSGKPHLAIPVTIDQRNIYLEPSSKIHLTAFLIGCFKCLSDQWDDGIQYLDQASRCDSLKLAARYMSGYGLYKQQKHSEAISALMETLRSNENITQRVKAQIYNLIGMCFENLGKIQLSIQMYKEGLSADFGFLRPLYNTSLQYRKLAVDNVELECLNLLVTALDMKDRENVQTGSIDLLQLVPIQQSDISYIEALYTFANRSLQLKRYSIAAEKYKKLLTHLQSWEAQDFSCLPPLLQVHHEAILSLLKANHLTDCLSLCNKVISSYHSKDSILDTTLGFSGNISEKFNESLVAKSSQNMNDSVFKLSKMYDESFQGNGDKSKGAGDVNSNSRTPAQYRGKRKREDNGSFIEESSMLPSTMINQDVRSTQNEVYDEDVVACNYKAEVLFKLGQQESALASAQRAIDSITSYKKKLFARKKLMVPSNPLSTSSQPPAKRARTDAQMDDTWRDDTQTQINHLCVKIQEHSESLMLEYELYLLMVRILKDMGQKSDALHFQRLAAQIKPIE